MLDEITNILGPDGLFARLCPGYEHREEQLDMARAVGDAILRKEHLIVEAGTGVGKTVGYLAPAIIHAAGGKPVIVSTHTINLQGQLINKDIPLMREVMEEHPFTAVLMKGRGNFLCLHELDLASGDIYRQGDTLFDQLKKWASETETGDIGELDFHFPEWSDVCCNQDTCKHGECPHNLERCFYYKMRRKAEKADIVVVNHSLFFSDMSIRMVEPKSAILPDYGAVIFDEAHHLEDVASNTFGIEFSNYRVPMLLNRVKKCRDLGISPGELQYIEGLNNSLFDSFNRVRRQEFFFDEMYQAVEKHVIEDGVNNLITHLDGLNTNLSQQDTEGNPELKDRLSGYRNMLGRMRDELRALFFDADPNYFRWAQKPTGGKFVSCYLHYTPISVADILKNTLWGGVESIICTSATLSNSGTFAYFRKRLGVPESNELIVGSPFDFKHQALLYVPDDLEAPSEKPEYAEAVAARVKELLLAAKGRAFLLFTSYRMLNAVFERLVDDVPFRLLRQGEMSNDRLIKEFREDETTCLMGVHSFWEGVDVKGERLSCVIIDKLPFSVPDTPTNKARCEQIEREGGNWFRDYAIPQAQIRLKQGFGRLVRTKTDHGVVAILDVRIHKKFYGREFLRYLPRCPGTKKISRVREFLGTVDLEEYAVAEDAS
ncbi:MAG: DEAD/DEAH box helicase family protein [Armatimonadetes bacterium]|nr:DEAD/DEAH box helicase family protein [Armatimonadota bacterium]